VKGKLIDLRGHVFGALTVIRRSYPWETPGYAAAEYRRKTRQARWVCKCICGGIKVMISQNLRKGDHRCSCKPFRAKAGGSAVSLDIMCTEAGDAFHATQASLVEGMTVDLGALTSRTRRELV
jgi:hypothetical protein